MTHFNHIELVYPLLLSRKCDINNTVTVYETWSLWLRGLTSTAEVKSLSMKETQAWGNCCIFCQSEGWIITYKQPIKMLNKTFKTKHQNNKSSHSESWISDWPIVTGIMIIILSLILLGFNSSKSIFKDNISSCHWRFFRILSQLLLHFGVFVWAMMSQPPCGSF